jgi:hypothetical protein
MKKILLTCILMGSWAVPGIVKAPQHAHSEIETTETIEAWVCPEPPQAPTEALPRGVPASVGIRLRHWLEFDGIRRETPENQQCIVEGEVSAWTYQCPALNQYQEDSSWKAGPAGWFAGGHQ